MSIVTIIGATCRGYDRGCAALQAATDGWFLPLVARLVFAAVLLVYFWTSALTKIGPGVFGFLQISDGAYVQILPGAAEAVGYDVSQLPAFPHGLIVVAGTYAEFLLPLLIVLGLFTRLAALGMIGFVAVQTLVDIVGHGAGAETIGALFDRVPDAQILDQRLLWLFLLLFLVVRGGGLLSLDALARRLAGSALAPQGMPAPGATAGIPAGDRAAHRGEQA